MKLQATFSIPIFLGTAGMGQNFGQIAPQIKTFDVYYDLPPAIGIDILGEKVNETLSGFSVVYNKEEGFVLAGPSLVDSPPQDSPSFIITEEAEEEAQDLGLDITPTESPSNIIDLEIINDPDKSSDEAGFDINDEECP